MSKKRLSAEAQAAWRQLPRFMQEKVRQIKTRYGRNICIQEMRQMGFRPAIIAEIVGISESQTWRVLQQKREQTPLEEQMRSIVKELDSLKAMSEGLFRAFRETIDLAIRLIIAEKINRKGGDE
jgi:hypothetical protein